MGDSTALTLGVGWDPSIDTNTEAYGQASFGCGLADGFPVSKRTVIATDPACRDWSDQWISAIARAGPRVVIVMAGAWEVLDHRLDKTTVRFGTSRWDDVVRAAFEKAVAAASSTDRPVALLTVPCYQQSTQSEQPALERNDPARVARANELLRSVAADHPNVTVIDYGAFVCPGGEYTEKLDGVSMRFDGVHLSADGARVTWEWLLPQLKKLDPDWFGP